MEQYDKKCESCKQLRQTSKTTLDINDVCVISLTEEWTPITDRLPDDKPNGPNVFITCDKDGFVYGTSHYFGGGCMDKDGFYNLVNGKWEYDEDVRYWMPLPQAPKWLISE